MIDRRSPCLRHPAASMALLCAALLCAAVLVGGCGSGGGSLPRVKPTQARLDARDFGATVGTTRQWLPLKPGMQWVREGATDVGHRRVPHRVTRTVTSASRQVEGVRTVLVLDQDVDAGQLAEQSLDYLAQDRRGNVWYLGSYTEEYEGGRFVSARDAWLAGVKGGQAGILMPADPRVGTPPYSVAQPPGADPDVAQVVKTGQSQCVTFRCFTGVIVIREGKASAPDNEFKYYAPEVGLILNSPRKASQHHDVERLINLRQLSPRGLAEVTTEALKLDRHAGVEKPDVFGRAPAAKQRG